ncbi:MAG: aldo/keto reductase [Pedosphaera sp.]|nr:aldo/keto reductase [Pedosphaera sp.]
MNPSRTAFGAWNGGRFMHYGLALDEGHWIALVQHAYHQGLRTFLTADVYGCGQADDLLGRALAGIPRDSYCLVGSIGHDFYSAKRDGSKGFPRFSNPQLRSPSDFAGYLRMATERSLERCKTDRFDLLLLHNPDYLGYSNDAVWLGMDALRQAKLADRLGIAPGPANGFSLDLILAFERFGSLIDWAMVILNPFEPWPTSLILPAALQYNIRLITRVVDYGGLFHGDVRPGHYFGTSDHRSFRPAGWVEFAWHKLDPLRPIAQRHNLSLLQLACAWNLQQPPVQCVVPTLIQEIGEGTRSIESKADELASLPQAVLSADELSLITLIGDNRGCMQLKGANRSHTTAPESDKWSITPDLEAVGRRWLIDPDRDLIYSHGE